MAGAFGFLLTQIVPTSIHPILRPEKLPAPKVLIAIYQKFILQTPVLKDLARQCPV